MSVRETTIRQFLLGMYPYILVQIKGASEDGSLDLDISYGGGIGKDDLGGFFAEMAASMGYKVEEPDDAQNP